MKSAAQLWPLYPCRVQQRVTREQNMREKEVIPEARSHSRQDRFVSVVSHKHRDKHRHTQVPCGTKEQLWLHKRARKSRTNVSKVMVISSFQKPTTAYLVTMDMWFVASLITVAFDSKLYWKRIHFHLQEWWYGLFIWQWTLASLVFALRCEEGQPLTPMMISYHQVLWNSILCSGCDDVLLPGSTFFCYNLL